MANQSATKTESACTMSNATASLHRNEQQQRIEDEFSSTAPFSDLCLVSPPPRNHNNNPNSTKRPPRIRSSLTPPPYSEKINRAIRTAECQLDAAVDDMHRYISQGCPDSDTVDRCHLHFNSPDSDYSDDLLSPKVLPNFNSPLNGENLASEFQFDDSNVENEEPNVCKSGGDDEQTHSGCPDKTKTDSTTKPYIGRLGCPSSPASNDVDEITIGPGTKGRILRFDGSKFQVWPPLNSSDSGDVSE
ncbi:hypothetical protein ACHAXN_003089 [Cyclotella atomus]